MSSRESMADWEAYWQADWEAAPLAPPLVNDTAHVWLLRLDADEATVARRTWALEPHELERAERFHFARHRRRFIVARATMKGLLASYLGLPAASLRIVYGEHGKPEMALPEGVDLRFNLSHAKDWALLAVCRRREIGIDIERHRSKVRRADLAKRFFTRQESGILAALPNERSRETFFRYWTLKEAFLKAHGAGLSMGLDEIDVSPLGETAEAPERGLRIAAAQRDWWLRTLAAPDGFSAALCVEGARLDAVVLHRPASKTAP